MDNNAESVQTWQPPVYNIDRTPEPKCTLAPFGDTHNFARSAKWSPDGSVALAQCENASFEYLDIPADLLSDVPLAARPQQGIFRQPSPVLDFAWYPYATPLDAASFCFLASVRECPVKLLDAADGRLRASYKIVDHRERQIAPHSLAFNTSATKIYCGFEDAIEVFDVNCPGEGSRWRTTPSKKSRDGLKGIISTLAFAPDASSGVFAAGTLSPPSPRSSNVAIFTEATGEVPVMYLSSDGVRASVTQVMFNPARPYMLYVAFRRRAYIYGWDLRGDVERPLQRFNRAFESVSQDDLSIPGNGNEGKGDETNQRLKFDVDAGGNWLSVGDQNGRISIFNLNATGTEEPANAEDTSYVPSVNPTLTYHAHNDAVGSVSFHPYKPLLLSVSGSRHFDEAPSRDHLGTDSEESEESDLDNEREQQGPTLVTRSRLRPTPAVKDASAKLWSFGAS